ncbi:MAG: hypothetical protein NC320_01790 [Clostridium sp.]|nr:hypothetical protein [Clostridium sp.]
MLDISGYIACIAEGNSETAVIDILLDNHCLIFEREQLLDEKVLRCRKADTFEKKYLSKGFDDKVTVFRILDSKKEAFKLSKAYIHKVNVVNIITAPEIEMLIIFNENRYDEYKKSKIKPSEFCKSILKYKNIKSYEFVRAYFDDFPKLINAIKKYRKISDIKKTEHSLFDLIKDEYKH